VRVFHRLSFAPGVPRANDNTFPSSTTGNSTYHPSFRLVSKGGPTSLDRFAAKLSYNELVDVMPLVFHLQAQAPEDQKDYKPHPVFVH